jgi:uncharacterized domain 1
MSANDDTNPPAPTSLVGAHWPGSLMERMGMDVIEHSAKRTVVTMPVEGNRQSAGLLHGGASAALAETAASLAAQARAHEVGAISAVGVELSISHLSLARTATVVATATAVHLGRTSTVHVVDVRDGEGRLVASARVSNRVLGADGPAGRTGTSGHLGRPTG